MPSSGYLQEDGVTKLIQKLKDRDPNIQEEGVAALVKIGEPAVEPLISALNDKDLRVRMRTARVLGEIKDGRAVEILNAAVKDRNLEVVAGAYAYFIRRGETRTEAILIEALDKYGYAKMAQDFCYSGNRQLERAGRACK